MAYQPGSDMLLQVDTDGNGSYSAVAAIQTKSLRLNAETVDVTNQDSSNKWRELLAGAGIKSMQVTGRGVFNDAASQNTVNTYFINNTHRNWRVIVPTLGTFQAAMQVSRIEYAGEHKGEVQYDISLDSAGALTYTAA